MKHVFIIDPIEGVKAQKDTSYYLMLAAYQRGHQVCYLEQRALFLKHDILFAEVTWLRVNDNHEQPFDRLHEQVIELAKTDVVWLRTDPPFDRRYFYTTLLLDQLPSTTRVINRPTAVRSWNEKMAALFYPKYTPQTLVSNEKREIVKFAEQFGKITIKPIDGFGGKGIVFYNFGDDTAVIDTATLDGSHWVIAQQYLQEAKDGDKRILLLNGEPLGAILRLHAEGVELNNLDAGGTAYAAELNERDLEICAAMKDDLMTNGHVFVGIDIIGGYLIEVNVTSPTGLQEMSRFNQQPYHHHIIAALET